MEKIIDPYLYTLYRRSSLALSIIVGLVAILALIGWQFNITFLKSTSAYAMALKPNSAVTFILISLSLILHQTATKGSMQFYLAKFLGLIVLIFGAAFTFENVTGYDLHIDELLYKDTGAIVYAPGRVPPSIAIAFVLIGITLIISNVKKVIIVENILSLIIGSIGLLVIIGTTYHISNVGILNVYIQASFYAAINLVLISIALIFLRPGEGIAFLMSSNTAGGVSIRRLIPPIIILPVVVGYLRLFGENEGWYDPGLGTALFAIIMIICASVVSFFVSEKLMREDIRRKKIMRELHYQAKHDVLTGLDNKISFEEKLNLVIKNRKANNQTIAILNLDLDHFKKINDSLGHAKGEVFLQKVAYRLKTIVKDYESIARFSEDTFEILLVKQRGIQEVINVANLVLTNLEHPFFIDEKECYITGSIGISCYPIDGTDAISLVKNADIALYEAKKKGRNCYQFCPENLQKITKERLELENRLHHAIEKKELVVHYQPVVNLKTSKIVSLEALLYWHNAEEGRIITPNEFIPVAEQNNLIFMLGEWVLREACLQFKKWQTFGIESIAVNVSVKQLHSNFIETVVKVLKEVNLDPRHLVLEITESSLMKEAEIAAYILNSLRKMGVRISIDDFGTGYSSFKYIKDFRVDYLKLDRSFVHDIPFNKNSEAISLAAIAVGHALGIRIIVEGIETKEQLEFFKNNKADEYQGFYFSSPRLANEIEILLKQRVTHPS
jgi:diguanylate cyclase (GGDEF)-like protein